LQNIGHGAIISHSGMQPPLPSRAGKVAAEGTSTIPRDCAWVPWRGCQRDENAMGADVWFCVDTHASFSVAIVLPPLLCQSINGQYVATEIGFYEKLRFSSVCISFAESTRFDVASCQFLNSRRVKYTTSGPRMAVTGKLFGFLYLELYEKW